MKYYVCAQIDARSNVHIWATYDYNAKKPFDFVDSADGATAMDWQIAKICRFLLLKSFKRGNVWIIAADSTQIIPENMRKLLNIA